MIKVSVSQTKNGLSGLLADVRRGETVLIMHRGRPVAKITRYPTDLADDEAAAELVRRGLADPPEEPFDVDRFLAATPRPRLTEGPSLSELIVEEREAGR